MVLPHLKLDTKFKRLVHKNLPICSSWVWKIIPIYVYDRILIWLYPRN